MKPAWVTGETPQIEAAAEKMRADVAAERLHTRAAGSLPLNRERAQLELSEEQRAHRSSRPRKRRWRELDKFDREIDELTAKQDAAGVRLTEAEARLNDAPRQDSETLAAWIAAGEKGERPLASVYERERERDAARLLVDAVVIELDRALERRYRHIERHRQKMLADVRKDVAESRRRLLEKVGELPALRDDLLLARELLLWAAAFPQPVTSYGFPTATALGLREPVRSTLGTSARVEYAALLAALEADATALAESYSAEQREQLGTAQPPTPLDEAMWADDPRAKAWAKQELERARRLGEWQDPQQLANEVHEMRP